MRTGVYLQTWHVGGVASFCARLAKGLIGLGHESVLVIATPYGKRDESGRRSYAHLQRNAEFPVACLHLNMFHPRERSWRAAEAIAALNCDALIMSAHGALVPSLAWLAGDTVVIGVAHTDDADTYTEFTNSAEHCHAYAAVSLAITQELERLRRPQLPVTIKHIPSGVPIPPEDAEPAALSGEARVLAVCRLVQRQKRVLDLPVIWQHYIQSGGKGTLTICGSGEEETHLRHAFRDEIGAQRVNLIGALDLDSMPELYARHDLLLSVSEYEGLPLTVMEAAAQGLYPLLSHTRSGHPQLVESLGQGRLCGVGDCRGFAEALLELTADVKTLRRQRAVIQKRASASFDLGRMIRAYADLLMEAVARPKGGMGARTPIELVRPRVDPFRSFVRRWQYARHYGWRSGKSVV